MKKIFTLSFLFAAMLLTASNSANAQPESFTQDFLQEDYRNGEVVRTNTVTVVWDAETGLLTFRNFYWNFDIVNNPTAIVNLPIGANTENVTSVTWISDTEATFTWRVEFMGFTTKSGYTTYRPYAVVCHMRKSSTTTGKDIYGVNTYYAYEGGSDCHGTINLETGEITLDNPWGLVCGHSDSYGVSNREGYKHMNQTTVVEGFDRSEMHIIKTDLVDIVNDGIVGKEYEVYDNLVGIATVDGVLSAPMNLGNNNASKDNAFEIGKGRYKLDLDLSTNPRTLTVSQSTADLTTADVNNGSDTYYIMGQVNGNVWAPNVGQPMVALDENHYSAVVDFGNEQRDDKYYFSFTHYLARTGDDSEWDNIAAHRFGAESSNYPVAMGDVLFAKDFGKHKNPSVISDGQIDFLGRVEVEYMGNTKLQPVAEFDQSNWVMLTGLTNANNYVGKIIKGKSITGTLVDKVNPTIAVTSTPTAGERSSYEPNIYIMPSFNNAYYASASHFFFVAPKAQEYANITWACYNDDDGNFYTMSDGNEDNLTGGMKVNWDYFPSGTPQDGYVYEFDAIIRKVASTVNETPALRDGNQSTPVTDDLSADYLVYPLRLYDVPTAIKTVDATGKVVDVKYYNLMGVESATPFNGVNIVVTIHDDGSRTTSKKLYK